MIQLDTDAQGIATLTINQADRTVNVIDWAFVQAMNDSLDRIASDASITGVVVTSGKGSFVAGADLSIMQGFVAPQVTPKDAADMIGRVGAVLRRLETLGKPVVGASTGTAMGGGLELLLACHHRIAANVPGAMYGLPEVTLGLLPGAGGTQRLPRMLGIAKAMPLLLSGRHLPTQEALELGILDRIVPADQLLAAAKQALREGQVPSVAPWDLKGYRMPGGDSNSPAANELFLLLNGSNFGHHHGLLPAPKAIASCVYEGTRLPIDRALRIERLYFAQLVQGSEAQAMIRTLFFARQALEKAPERPAKVPRAKLSRIAVLGDATWHTSLRKAAIAAGLAVDAAADPQSELLIGDVPGALMLRWFQAREDLPPLMEIAPNASTTDEQLARGFDLARQLRAVPVLLSTDVAGDVHQGYVVACIQAALDAGHQLLARGVSPVVLNNATIANGWPSMAAMAAAIGREWAQAPATPREAHWDLHAVESAVDSAQRETARAWTTAPARLGADAANLAAVLGAGYPRQLGGPLAPTHAHE